MAKIVDLFHAWRRAIVSALPAAISLSYLSALVPGSVIAVCGDVGDGPILCPVPAYGLPLPYIADNPALSPANTVSRNPVWWLLGEDNFLLPQFGLSVATALVLVLLGRSLWRRWRSSSRR